METTPCSHEWLTTSEAAEILGIQKCAVYYHIRKGHLVTQGVPTSGRGGTGYEHALSRASVVALREGWNPQEIPAYEFSPSETDCAYLAGLIDGEGTIIIRTVRHRYYSLLLAVYNTNAPVLDWIATTFGATKSAVYRNHQREGRVPGYAWTAQSFRAYHVLRATLPYLQIKKEQALLGIEFQEASSSRYRHRWNQVSDDDLKWREEQRVRIQKLNRSKYLPAITSP